MTDSKPGALGSDGPREGLASRLERTLYRESLDCVHCGLCLSSCPTYRATGRETASPRGRIYLMRGFAEGRLADRATLEDEAFACLGCRACETACPSGVHYGEMLEQTRAALRSDSRSASWAARLERFLLRHVVPHRRRLALAISLTAWLRGSGLDRGLQRVLPEGFGHRIRLLPKVPPRVERARLPAFTPAVGARRGRVALFEGCIMPELFGRVNESARRVLSRAGYDVVVPPAQGCCGALQAHGGDLDAATALARANLEAFETDAEFDAVLSTSAGCGAALRECENWLGESAGEFAGRVRDVLEFLDEVGARLPLRALPGRVCYDDPCHLLHAQSVESAPRRLLRAIPELELVVHRDAAACCGAAGIYNLTHPEMSEQVLAPKLDALLAAHPEIVATANPGCAMQLAAGLEGRGAAIPVVHPIELLDRASASGE